MELYKVHSHTLAVEPASDKDMGALDYDGIRQMSKEGIYPINRNGLYLVRANSVWLINHNDRLIQEMLMAITKYKLKLFLDEII